MNKRLNKQKGGNWKIVNTIHIETTKNGCVNRTIDITLMSQKCRNTKLEQISTKYINICTNIFKILMQKNKYIQLNVKQLKKPLNKKVGKKKIKLVHRNAIVQCQFKKKKKNRKLLLLYL